MCVGCLPIAADLQIESIAPSPRLRTNGNWRVRSEEESAVVLSTES
jgi:hypothetical protein